MPGGHHCCIVSCTTSSKRCKGLTFHTIPSQGKNSAQDEWRKKIIHAVNRCDKSFNPLNARICSRHFSLDCFTPHGKGRKLKVNSLPTLFMPQKSIPSVPVVPRKPPVHREPPVIPEVVHYLKLEDMLKDAQAIRNWIIIDNSAEIFSLGQLENDVIKYKVVVTADLRCSVFIKGHKIEFEETAVEKFGLKRVINDITSKKICLGIRDKELQQYADICSKQNESRYYKELLAVSPAEEMISSTVRSKECTMLSNDDHEMCFFCAKIKVILQKKHSNKCVHPNTPLTYLSKEMLSGELKAVRLREKKLKLLLKKNNV